jgi:hypothetical protein
VVRSRINPYSPDRSWFRWSADLNGRLHEDLLKRGKVNLEQFWLKDKSLSEASGVHLMVIAKYEQGRREPSWLSALDLLRVMHKTQSDLEREYDAGGQAGEAGTVRKPK